ncbi:MAG: glycosyltransferase [Lachnospiraceae bacterium]|nr:glycosyltransferase [Lachnospiraceae bacterium]
MKREIISIIIPCYRSEKYLASTVEGIYRAVGDRMDCRFILINDGSGDGTYDVIRGLCGRYPGITGLDLDRNYGQNSAKMAGIPYIKGKYAVFMDDDGQHDPGAILKLKEKIDEGYDLVYAQFPRMEEAGWRRAASFLNDRILSMVTKKPGGLVITSYFALGPRSVSYLKRQKTYAGTIGFTLFPCTKRVTGVMVDHRERTEGGSNYTLRKLFRQWVMVVRGSRRSVPAGACGVREVT